METRKLKQQEDFEKEIEKQSNEVLIFCLVAGGFIVLVAVIWAVSRFLF